MTKKHPEYVKCLELAKTLTPYPPEGDDADEVTEEDIIDADVTQPGIDLELMHELLDMCRGDVDKHE